MPMCIERFFINKIYKLIIFVCVDISDNRYINRNVIFLDIPNVVYHYY